MTKKLVPARICDISNDFLFVSCSTSHRMRRKSKVALVLKINPQ